MPPAWPNSAALIRTHGPPQKDRPVAHDNNKPDLLAWARFNRRLLIPHELYATGTTGGLLERELGITLHKLLSGPLGGDQQIGAKIATGDIDFLIFFWDPLEPQPHDPDVKALIRLAVVWNIPVACNLASADYIISSPLLSGTYPRVHPDYAAYLGRSRVGEQPSEPSSTSSMTPLPEGDLAPEAQQSPG